MLVLVVVVGVVLMFNGQTAPRRRIRRACRRFREIVGSGRQAVGASTRMNGAHLAIFVPACSPPQRAASAMPPDASTVDP